jgi:hypothetical protein
LNAAKNWHQNSGAKRLDNMSGGMRDVYRKVPRCARAYFWPSRSHPKKKKAAFWPPKRTLLQCGNYGRTFSS